MQAFELLTFLSDYAGVIVGLVLVIVATFVLPARVRWYVLTAGLAVVAFRAFQIFFANRRLKELDAQREKLRAETEALRKKTQAVADNLGQLNAQSAALKEQKRELNRQRETLYTKGEDLAANKEALDRKITVLEQKDIELMASSDPQNRALFLFEEAERTYQELERAAGR